MQAGDEPLQLRQASGVVLDECHAHGVWLDNDALAKFGVLGQSGQSGSIPKYMTERDHDTLLGAVLELVGRLF